MTATLICAVIAFLTSAALWWQGGQLDRHEERIANLEAWTDDMTEWANYNFGPPEATNELPRVDVVGGKKLPKGDTQPVNLTKADKTKKKPRHAA